MGDIVRRSPVRPADCNLATGGWRMSGRALSWPGCNEGRANVAGPATPRNCGGLSALDGQHESIPPVMLRRNCLLIDVLSLAGGTAPTGDEGGRSRPNRFTTMSLCKAIRLGLFTALIATALVGERVDGCAAQTSPAEPAKASPRKQSAGDDKDVMVSESRYTAGLVAGVPQSTELAIAHEIATTLATGQETGPHGEMALRVLPIVGNGGVRNAVDVLTLAGADMAIAPVVLVDRLRDSRTLGDIRDKLVYITPLFGEEFHLIARPEIKTLADLAGKRINLGEEGGAGAVLGLEVLNSLDVKFDEANLSLETALDEMGKGRLSATLLISAKPVASLARYTQFNAVRLLPIPYSPALRRDYLPSTLRHEDYPSVLGVDESVETIAVKSALFAYNWPSRNERYHLLESFVQTFFSRFSEFLGNDHHPRWREVNRAAPLPGWQRFGPADRWLQRQAFRGAFDRFLEQHPMNDQSDRETLFRDFLRWRERNKDK
jgi:uncharacterized protein